MEDKGKNGAPKNRVAAQVPDQVPASAPVAPVAPVAVKPQQVKHPATEANYLAAQIHELRVKIMNQRNELIEKAKSILQRDQIILQKDQVIAKMETAAAEEDNKQLRAEHGLAPGRTLHKDDVTGEVYWLGDPIGD